MKPIVKYATLALAGLLAHHAAFALDGGTQWWDIPPTNTINEVVVGAGIAKTNDTAALDAAVATNTANIATNAANIATNAAAIATNAAAIATKQDEFQLIGEYIYEDSGDGYVSLGRSSGGYADTVYVNGPLEVSIGIETPGIEIDGTPDGDIIVDTSNGALIGGKKILKAGDAVSSLTNDAGYVTASITNDCLAAIPKWAKRNYQNYDEDEVRALPSVENALGYDVQEIVVFEEDVYMADPAGLYLDEAEQLNIGEETLPEYLDNALSGYATTSALAAATTALDAAKADAAKAVVTTNYTDATGDILRDVWLCDWNGTALEYSADDSSSGYLQWNPTDGGETYLRYAITAAKWGLRLSTQYTWAYVSTNETAASLTFDIDDTDYTLTRRGPAAPATNYYPVVYSDEMTNCVAALTVTVEEVRADFEEFAASAVSTVALTNANETMASISDRLDAINAAGKHVFFDTAGIDADQALYLVTIYIDQSNDVVRVSDQVTGKLYIGAYDADETIGEIFGKAVDSYVAIVVTAETLDGVTVTNQVVTLYEGADATGSLRGTASYEGAPVSFTVPKGFEYYLTISADWEGDDHFGPHVTYGSAHGYANVRTATTFAYYDADHIDTSSVTNFTELQSVLAYFGSNASSAANNLVGIEIPDAWEGEDGTSYDDPMVVVDCELVEAEDGTTNLAAICQRKWATLNTIVFDERNQELAEEDAAVSGVHYFGFAAPFATNATYAAGVFATYNGELWRCATAVTTAGEWTGTANWASQGATAANVAAFDPSETYTNRMIVAYNDGTAYRLWRHGSSTTTGDWTGTTNWTPLSLDILDSAASLPELSYSTGDALDKTGYLALIRNTAYTSSDVAKTRNIIRYGHNRYRDSAYRRYLNSAAAKGAWWTQGHAGQMPPSNAYTTRGYMAGCSSNLLAAVRKARVQQYTNSSTDAGAIDEMYDYFWLPSRRQMYGGDNGNEGAHFPYWKQIADEYMTETLGLEGETSPTDDDRSSATTGGAVCATRKQYSIKNHSSAVNCRLRSATRGYSYLAWIVTTAGNLNGGYGAYTAYASVPACAIW